MIQKAFVDIKRYKKQSRAPYDILFLNISQLEQTDLCSRFYQISSTIQMKMKLKDCTTCKDHN